MRRSTKWALSALVATTLVTGSMAGAGALPWQQGPNGGAPPPARRRLVVLPVSEAAFVSVNPCRLADTRVAGGPVTAGSSRRFAIRGSAGFVAQGGTNGGCGIPTGASSVDLSITAVTPSGVGYLRAYPTGATPTATILNYAASQSISVTSELKLAAASSAQPLSLAVYGSATQIVIDVVGYHAPPLTAYVDTSGTLVSGTRVVASKLESKGVYTVTFDRSVVGCSYQATPYDFNYVVAAGPGDKSPADVTVFIHDQGATQTFYDDSFFLTVSC